MGTDPPDTPDDYYALLGVEIGADAADLRRAWRRLALRWHPDRAGSAAKGTFQTLLAAYAVLADPVTRAAYDRRRGAPARRDGTRGASVATAPISPPGTAPASPPVAAAPATPAAPARRRAPAVMLDRLTGPLTTLLACGIARRAEPGVFELRLDPEETAQGGMVSISMRVPVRCPACAAADGPAGPCARCGGRRTVEELYSAWLAVPPEIADGTVLTPSALLPGMVQPVSFRMRRPG